MSLIDEDGEQGRCAWRTSRRSRATTINGVAALHSRLLRETVLRDFAELWPERFTNVTNGVTPRRFVALANPRLVATCITEAIGDGWLRDLEQLRELEPLADDAGVPGALARRQAREQGRARGWLRATPASTFDPTAMLDAQCKRIHEYKRQHLNLLHVIALYRAHPQRRDDGVPRTIVFAGKAAPGYRMAKLIIRLAHGVAEAIARRPARARAAARRVRPRLQRQERAAHLSGRRSVGADLDRRASRRPAPAT